MEVTYTRQLSKYLHDKTNNKDTNVFAYRTWALFLLDGQYAQRKIYSLIFSVTPTFQIYNAVSKNEDKNHLHNTSVIWVSTHNNITAMKQVPARDNSTIVPGFDT